MDYTLEELLPVVKKLSEAYTSKESTSIPWETARQLMTAVLYCLNEGDLRPVKTSSSHLRKNHLNADEAYAAGRRLVYEKTVAAKELYQEILNGFDAYENTNYYHTVVLGMPAFFQYYDIDFAPHDHLLTLDYPLLKPLEKQSGINAIWNYLKAVQKEQQFLEQFPRQHILHILQNEYPDYRGQILNICAPILGHTLCSLLLARPPAPEGFSDADFSDLAALCSRMGEAELDARLQQALSALVRHVWKNAPALEEYLQAGLKDLQARLMQFSCLYPDCKRFHF